MIEIDQGENVIRTVRKHWFVLLGKIFMLVVLVAIPVILLVIMNIAPIEKVVAFAGDPGAVGGFFLASWLLVVWMISWGIWTDYYLDVLLVTDKRVFDIEQHGLFRRESSSFRLDRIQNVTVEQHGIIQTLLDFGSIRIETAGEREDFIANYMVRPYDIKKFLNDAQDTATERARTVHIASAAAHLGGVGFAEPGAVPIVATPDAVPPPGVERMTRKDGDGMS